MTTGKLCSQSRRLVTAACVVMALQLATAQAGDFTAETPAQKDARMAWWAHDRFGMFIHFGLYATLARHEWVQRYESIPSATYEKKYMPRFNPDLFDARAWAKAAKNAGMKYMVLTTKHHEGFAMWDTKVSDFKITNTAFKRDLVREYVDACRAEGLKVGFYFSIIDWHHPDFKLDQNHPETPRRNDSTVTPIDSVDHAKADKLNEKRDMAKYRKFMMAQLTELLTEYGKIDILFFDFTWRSLPSINQPEDYDCRALLNLARTLQPAIIINDRLGIPEVANSWDIKTPEQVTVPKCPEVDGHEVYWETCQTFSGSWGYHRDEDTWKSPSQLLDLLVDTVSKKGNLLLNVGPTARGNFDNRALLRLEAMGAWLRVNGRSIYGCTAAPAAFTAPQGTKLTYNPALNRLYVHILEWPIKVLPVTFFDKIEYAQFLHDGSEIKVEIPKNVSGTPRTDVPASMLLPVKKPAVEIPVVEMFLKN